MADLLDALRGALGDRYDMQQELGRGGMATVFLAEDLKHRRSVAIKVIHPELAAATGLDRFLREIEIAARLQHPHIMPLYDSGAAGIHLYYVMPFIEGESLRDLLNRDRQLSLDEAIRITTEVCGALGYAHSRGIVHRDIKPENILLSGGTAIVADFGIARAISAGQTGSLTQTGMVVGTPSYMSPEQATASVDVDGRSDIYSLGCVLYEMLVGEPPFTGPTIQAVMARHSLDQVSRPQIVRDTIPDGVEDAVLTALAKLPADRFATAALFAEALAGPRTTTGSRRRVTTPPTAAHPATPPPPPRRRSRVIPWVAAGAGLAAVVSAVAAFLNLAPATVDGPDPRRIAVLYFDDRSPAADLGFIADGLTEALIHELSEVQTLDVISRNGVLPYRKAAATPDSISRALGVGTIVGGTVASSNGVLRVDVSLINAATGAEIDSKRLERPRTEIFALQDDIASEVSAFLRERLGQEIQLRERQASTRDQGAWELMRQAERLRTEVNGLIDAGETAAAERELARADSLLARAEGRDSRWHEPIVLRGWIADDYLRLPGSSDNPYTERWIGVGLTHAERALRLTPRDADALFLRGWMRYLRWLSNLAPTAVAAETLFAAAEQDFRAAVDINRLHASAWTALSHLLFNKAEPAEAKLAALRAYEGDPYLTSAPTTLWRLFAGSLDLEDRIEANRWCDEGLLRFPTNPRFVECQLWLFALRGQPANVSKAWQLLSQYAELSPPNLREFRRVRGQMLVAMALARAGLADSARSVAEHSRGNATLDPGRELMYLEAIVRTMVGDNEIAIRQLGTFVAANPQQRDALAKDQTWWFEDLRSEPRFKSLVSMR